MKLKEIFEKPIDRSIEGVIKADDLASLKLEVEEYVITNEVSKRLEELFGAYNDYGGANGVWISGFFGSGKSHLLKMLALLLENRQIDEVSIGIFSAKVPGCYLSG
jgi:DNA replication protein DnaC